MTESQNQSAQASKPATERGRSTIEFPYFDLDDAVNIAKSVHGLSGPSCMKEQLAGRLNMAADGGGFSIKLSAARMFGVLQLERGQVNLTDLGIRLTDLQQEKSARVEAFLKVPLYNKVYELFKGRALPPRDGLEGTMENLGVAPKQKDKARQVFLRSAKQAGFFDMSADRLVMPPTSASGNGKSGIVVRPPSGGVPSQVALPQELNRHPFIQGLLQTIPPEGSEWTVEDRAKWLQGAASIFDVIYKDSTIDGKKHVYVRAVAD
jgi:hypothetical protein